MIAEDQEIKTLNTLGEPWRQTLLSAKIKKSDVLSTLRLIADEPNYYSELFGYKEYADRLFDLLSHSLPEKAFAICLDGKWGEGKTSMLMRIHNKLRLDSQITNNKTMWFDAWKNEDIFPIIALLQKIVDVHDGQDSDSLIQLQELLIELTTMQFRSEGNNYKIEDISVHLKHIMDGREMLPSILDSVIGENNKLFIFIDHLDRCGVQYIKDMLKAIAMHLNASRIRFIVGVDLGKIEGLLQPAARDDSGTDASNRSMQTNSYLDKIFQLKLVLPAKDEKMMHSYVDSVAGRFPKPIQDFLARALPTNPRKAKEAMNLAFYVSSLVDEEEFDQVFPYVLIWSILATSYHNLSNIIHKRPETLFDMSIVVSQTKDFSKFTDVLELSGSDESLFFINLKLPRESISPLARKLCYSHVMHDAGLYNYLKALKLGLRLDLNIKKDQIDSIAKAIKYIGLVS